MVDKRLLTLVPQAKKEIAKTVAAQYMGLIATICFSATLAYVLAAMLAHTSIAVYTCLGVCAVAIILKCASSYATELYSFNAARDIKLVLRSKIYEKLARLDVASAQNISTAELIQTTVEGTEQLEVYFGKFLPQLVYACLAPLTLFVVLAFVNIAAAAALLVFVPLIPAIIMVIQSIAKRVMGAYWKSYTNLGDVFLENLQGLVTLKIYNADKARHETMNEQAQDFRRATMRLLKMQLNSIMVMDVAAFGGAVAGMSVAFFQLLNGSLDVFGFLLIVLLSAEFFIPMRTLGSYFHIAMNGMSASNKIFTFLNTPETKRGIHDLPVLAQKSPMSDACTITFDHVSFAYPLQNNDNNEAPVNVLHDVSFTLPTHGMSAFVGASGSGKSTIAHLIAGAYPHFSGNIMLNGRSINDINTNALSRAITTVSAENYIFSGTIREMLLLADRSASDELLWHVLKQARIADFVQSHGGLEMHVETQGANLSGGQKQRLCFARALLHNSAYYIFDEATNSIDVESEEHLNHAIQELATTKGVLVISHRLVNVVPADCIYVLDKGILVGKGTHTELLAHCLAYQTMWKTQQKLEQIRQGELA